jgi:2-dehydro-3-deoxygluconokinase
MVKMDSKQYIDGNLVAFGEIMMRLNCPSGKRFQNSGSFEVLYGGAEANVCVFLSRLGLKSRFITRLPENDLAQGALDQLRSSSVDVSCIASGGSKMGLYFTEDGNLLRPSRVIYDRQDSSFAGIARGMVEWQKILDGTVWFHWSGIAPAVSETAAEVCLEALQSAKEKGTTISADFNYRSTLWNYGSHPSSVMPRLLSFCDVVTGDINSAAVYFGISVDNKLPVEEQFRICAGLIKQKLPSMKVLAMSFRNTDSRQRQTYRGAIFFNNDFYFSECYNLPLIVDRIGSGDAFMGGLIYSIWKGWDPQKIIAFATASGLLKHSIAGDMCLLSEKEIQNFIDHGPDSRLIR